MYSVHHYSSVYAKWSCASIFMGLFCKYILLDSYQLRFITGVNKGKINLTHYLRNREVNKLLSAIKLC